MAKKKEGPAEGLQPENGRVTKNAMQEMETRKEMKEKPGQEPGKGPGDSHKQHKRRHGYGNENTGDLRLVSQGMC